MWSEPSDRMFRYFCGELTACGTEVKESEKPIKILKCRRNVPTQYSDRMVIIKAQLSPYVFDNENL